MAGGNAAGSGLLAKGECREVRPRDLHLIKNTMRMVQQLRGESKRLELGSKFGMDMKMGILPYRVTSTVVEFEENRLIAWAHFGKHRWRYELEPMAETDGGGTKVTESFDWSTAALPKAIELMGYPKKHPANMEATLERLATVVEA